jgi:polyvinyl alcohol dehydrogenase (cytochrome)
MRSFSIFLILVFTLAGCQNSSSKKQSAGNDSASVQKAGDAPLHLVRYEKPSAAVSEAGKQVFISTCSSCHKDSAGSLAPAPAVLAGMTARSILAALDKGKMRVQAEKLTEDQRASVAQFITNKVLKQNSIPKDVYTTFSLPDIYNKQFDQSGWGGNLEATGYRTSLQAGINTSNISRLKLKWAFAFPDATQARSKPALIGDWLIVGSEFGEVYAINTQTGRPGWNFTADAAVRGAISAIDEGNKITAYFADYSTNVYAVDLRTGKLIWKTRSGYHPLSAVTGSVAVFNNMVFVPITSFEVVSAKNPDYDCCSSSGGVVALDATTGNIIWKYKVISEPARKVGKKKNGKDFYGPAGTPVWCSPTVDTKRGLLYIGTGENYSYPATNSSDAVQALDLKTGKLAWSYQGTQSDTWNLACPGDPNCPDKAGPDLDFGMAPLLIHQDDGNDILIAGQKSGVVHALSTGGKLLWKTRIGKGGGLGGVHWGMATDGKYVYAANADNLYAIDQRDSLLKATPGIYAIDIKTGKVIWESPAPACGSSVKGCVPANSAAPTAIPGIVFAAGLDGHLRAYSAKEGKIIWDFNTARDFETVNKIKGNGGAMDGPAPLVSNGMLFVNSGYGMFGEMPGNVLLAFEIQKN